MRRQFPLLLLLTVPVVSAQTLTLRFLDVGQGDAILITAPVGQTLLYDGGRSRARMRELIRQYSPERLQRGLKLCPLPRR